ncbi:MAG: response regulator [Bacteroidales bacterium]|nr:response regulator [Bacteroidales bacterium]MBS3775101.1 response regulator [Bacteroidales bacterium]
MQTIHPKKNWQGKTILIAEDEESNFKYLQLALRDTQVNIIRAKNGKEAVDLCRKHTDIDLVLMDIKMPGMDGFQATKEIRQFAEDLPIIALTAYAMADDKDTSLEAGCNDYISKPVKRNRIFSILDKYL